MAGKAPSFEHGDDVFEAIKDLHEKIAALDPSLVTALSFGPRDHAPAALDADLVSRVGPAQPDLSTKASTFRNYFSDDDTGGFTNSFSKGGDGFINIHTVAA